MSSCKLWRDKQVGRHRDKAKSCNSSHKTPALLRLDSTGEVSAFDSTPVSNSKMCRGKNRRFCTSDRQQREKLSLQSVWNGLGMSSVLNTANSYLSTASNYLESLYPATSKCLIDHRYTPNKDSMVLCDSTMSTSTNDKSGAWPHSSKSRDQVVYEDKKPWTREILGALHSTVFNTDTSQNSHPKVDRYIPPPLRHRYLQEKQGHIVNTDPSHARHSTHLLEKTKHRYIYPNKHQTGSCKKAGENSHVETKQSENVGKESSANHINLPLNFISEKNHSHKKDVLKTNTDKYTDDLSGSVMDLAESDSKTVDKNDSADTDWFEYENKCEITIPFEVREPSFDKPFVNDKLEENITDQPRESGEKMLHSWYSVDNDTEVKKVDTTPNISSPSTPSQAQCDNDVEYVQNLHLNSGNKCSVTDEVNEELAYNARLKSSCKVEHYYKSKNDSCVKQHVDNDRKNELISVLYVRNCTSSKRRPSAHKRSRHKAQKSSNKPDWANDKSSKSLKHGNAVHPNSSIAFILGVDCDKTDNHLSMQSFQINCEIDDLDWSSDESDDTADSIDCDDFDLCPVLSLMNFQVTCSVPPKVTSILSPSPIEKINLEWEINISVEPEKQKKPQSSKKVLFKFSIALTLAEILDGPN